MAVTGQGWDGDLRNFTITSWWDESEIAAIAVADGSKGRGWINLRHVPPPLGRIVTKWCSHAAARRAPWMVLWSHEVADLVAVLSLEQHAEPE